MISQLTITDYAYAIVTYSIFVNIYAKYDNINSDGIQNPT